MVTSLPLGPAITSGSHSSKDFNLPTNSAAVEVSFFARPEYGWAAAGSSAEVEVEKRRQLGESWNGGKHEIPIVPLQQKNPTHFISIWSNPDPSSKKINTSVLQNSQNERGHLKYL